MARTLQSTDSQLIAAILTPLSGKELCNDYWCRINCCLWNLEHPNILPILQQLYLWKGNGNETEVCRRYMSARSPFFSYNFSIDCRSEVKIMNEKKSQQNQLHNLILFFSCSLDSAAHSTESVWLMKVGTPVNANTIIPWRRSLNLS